MDFFERIVYFVDYSLDTPRKRHIIGGFLVSASMLFGGLAVTVMTIKKEEVEYEE